MVSKGQAFPVQGRMHKLSVPLAPPGHLHQAFRNKWGGGGEGLTCVLFLGGEGCTEVGHGPLPALPSLSPSFPSSAPIPLNLEEKTGHREAGLSARPLRSSLVSNTSSSIRTELIKGSEEGQECGRKEGREGQGEKKGFPSYSALSSRVQSFPCLWGGEECRASQGPRGVRRRQFLALAGLRRTPTPTP